MSEPTTLPAPEIVWPPAPRSKGDHEYLAFQRLLPSLLQTHRGQYVAVHEGQVIDTDVNDIALIQRVHSRIGYVPIHVGLVTDRVVPQRLPHYREIRVEAEG